VPAAEATQPIASPTPVERGEAWSQLPDWSGTWHAANVGILDPATASPKSADGSKPGDRIRPPYSKEYAVKYARVLARRKAGENLDPARYCMPVGMPRLLTQPLGVRFLVTPEMTWMIWEYDGQVRRIFTDGRDHPPADELTATWTGNSVGRWEGDTLIVDTVGLREPLQIMGVPDQTVDRTGATLSDQVTIKERIRRVGDTIEDDVTITDPVALTKPWKIKRLFKVATTGQYLDDIIYCNSPTLNGRADFTPPTTREEYLHFLEKEAFAPKGEPADGK